MGYSAYEGQFRLTIDPHILQQLDMSTLPKPGLRRVATDEIVYDDLNVTRLDKYEFDLNMFLEAHTGESEDELTILPINLHMEAFIGQRQGIGSDNGPSQEASFKWGKDPELNFLDC